MIPLHRGDHFAMMEIYADESGVHGSAEWCIVAGFSAGRRHWIRAEEAWLKLLDNFHIPRESGFHSKDFFKASLDGNRLNESYLHLSINDCTEFLRCAAVIIRSHALCPIGAAVNIADFNSLSLNERRWITGGVYYAKKWKVSGRPSSPYFLAFHEVMIAGVERANPGVICDFIFDRQDVYSGYALKLWNHLKDNQHLRSSPHLGTIAFASRLDRVALQIADLLTSSIAFRKDSSNPQIVWECEKFHSDINLPNARLLAMNNQGLQLLLEGFPSDLKETGK